MYLEEIKIGTRYELEPVVMDKEEMFAFARQYDPIPLHLDENYAKASRFGGLIAPGLMSFAVAWGRLEALDIFGPELVAGKTARIEWFTPVYMGDTICATGELTGVYPRNPYNGVAEITLSARNQQDQLLFTAVVEAVIRRRPEEA